jgi:phosphoglycolate phosphatase
MLQIDGREYSPRLIILDKDGTLIEFGPMWHTWFDRFVRYIHAHRPLATEARVGLSGTLGYEIIDGNWHPEGPLTLASTGEVLLLTAGVVYQYGDCTWSEALALVQAAENAARDALNDPDLLTPVGDAAGKLRELSRAGYLLALATTDTRASTEAHLARIGADGLFGAIVCGDDGIRLKPAPDMALALCERLGVDPGEAVLVGDTPLDMAMARAAGLMAAIGVGTGPVPADRLRAHADVVVADIHAIRVGNGQG